MYKRMQFVKEWWAKHWKALLLEVLFLFVAGVLGALLSLVPALPFPAWVNMAFIVAAIQTAQAKVNQAAQNEAQQLLLGKLNK